jgi:biopolymer transport protein ExbD
MPKVLPIPTGASRGGRGRRVSTTLAEINVIPLVDVMLVLLIIFMVTAPMLQRSTEVTLPVASRSQDVSAERLYVDVPLSFRDNENVFIEKESIGLPFLEERMRQLLLNRTDKNVFLRMDARLTIQDQMKIGDSLKGAGVVNMGIITDPPPIK